MRFIVTPDSISSRYIMQDDGIGRLIQAPAGIAPDFRGSLASATFHMTLPPM